MWTNYKPRGKKVQTEEGYILVYCPEHPNANKNNGKYIYEHRLVMSNMLGRPLRPDEVVHHKNGVRSDNRPENLELHLNGEHVSSHYQGRTSEEKASITKRLVDYNHSQRKKRELVPCACGCGRMIENVDAKGRSRKYAHGHNNRKGWN